MVSQEDASRGLGTAGQGNVLALLTWCMGPKWGLLRWFVRVRQWYLVTICNGVTTMLDAAEMI